MRPKEIGIVTLVFISGMVFLALLGYVSSSGQRELAARVDTNARIARERGETVLTQLVRHRYVSDCLLFAPPAPERSVTDLETCLNEANELTYLDGDRIGAVLVRNLKERGIA